MTKKTGKIDAMLREFEGRELDAHYLGYFACFNRQLFFEAHDVLEQLWLTQRSGPNAAFYKGLIQLAGAFVHLQKDRLRPAAALFGLAAANLKQYPERHEQLDLANVLRMIDNWVQQIHAEGVMKNPLTTGAAPRVELDS